MSIRNPNRSALSRRRVLATGMGAAALASMGLPLRQVLADEAAPTTPTVRGKGKAKQVVVLFMGGGASHIDTLDPKPGTPTGGTTKAIPTAVDGIQIADSLPMLAKRMKDICVVRGMTSREGNHERARYLMHTGYAPNPTVVHPGLGSMLSHEVGDPNAALPHYICVNGTGARPGYLGVNHAPFVLRLRGDRPGGEANQRRRRGASQRQQPPVPNLEAARGVDGERLDRRLELLGELNGRFAKDRDGGVPTAQAAMFERARRLMDSPKNTAFDLAPESVATRERYGRTQFGNGCLMARRLLDEGVTCVEVSMGGWDTHDDNFARVRALNTELDRGAAALLDDLRANGKLDETLVVWVGDFGRTPRITPSQGRGHYPRAWSMFLAGGGIEGGQVVGATDPSGSEVVEGAVTVPNLFASIAHATGFQADKTFFHNGRPLSLVFEEGKVEPAFFGA